MCHGHPRKHACSHTSINWHYCPSAMIDLETGVETPCSRLSYAVEQNSAYDCPLQNCQYKAKGGSWICCQCSQGPNTHGWCDKPVQRAVSDYVSNVIQQPLREECCSHGCCNSCVRSGSPDQVSSSDMTFPELRKGTASRKFGYHATSRPTHRRGSALSVLNNFPPVLEEDFIGQSDLPAVPEVPPLDTFARNSSLGSALHGKDRSFAGMHDLPVPSSRKHKGSLSPGKGPGTKKHKLQAC